MIFTPLRYPGGKSKFSPTIKDIITVNQLNGHYVEPYAGGAGIALDLLFNHYCTDIHINDLDMAIYNFWVSITRFTDDFLKLINDTPVTIEEWKRQKSIIASANSSELERGFAAFFLNRTNRSGILKAGVIGGINQNGNYKLDCRFNKKDLTKRIEKIGDVANHIHIYNRDTLDWLLEIDSIIPENSLIYLDPPYYEKGKGLYRNFYKHDDHVSISHQLANIKKPWIVSYDNHMEIKNMYKNYRQSEYSLNYSAYYKRKGSEVMIYCNQIIIPS